jgi:hypothetical protein
MSCSGYLQMSGFRPLASWQAAATLREPAMKPDTTLVSLSMRELDRLKVIEAVAEARLMTWRAAGLRCK